MIMVVVFTRRQSILADSRLKIVNEVLQGIRVVKFYAWEKSFLKRVAEIRSKEIQFIFKISATFQGFICLFNFLPILIPLLTFSVYTAINGPLTVVVIFRSLAFFQALQIPLVMIPIALSQVGVGLVSARRVQSYLLQPDLDPDVVKPPSDPDMPVAAVGSFTYDPKSETAFKLQDIQFQARKNQLTAVIGNVGSGKSTLLSTLLGEMHKVPGSDSSVEGGGEVAYVAQKPWIQTQTVRQNILFGRKFEEARYRKCVRACALDADFLSLPSGDHTEIGDRGINLSGGQKQRVAIARAVYSGCETVFLDDPLSAVDANVGENIMTKCITGALKGTTRVLVLNQLHFLPLCDYIYLMDEGKVVAEGTFEELNSVNERFKALMKAHADELDKRQSEAPNSPRASSALRKRSSAVQSPPALSRTVENAPHSPVGHAPRDLEEDGEHFGLSDGIELAVNETPFAGPTNLEREESTQRELSARRVSAVSVMGDRPSMLRASYVASAGDDAEIQKGQLIEAEEINKGAVSLGVYLAHFRRMGVPTCIVFLFFAISAQACLSGSTFVLSWWSSDEFKQTTSFYLTLYAVVGISGVFFILGRGLVFSYGTKTACAVYHQQLFSRAMRASCTFYDVTPIGRVLNRFSKDIGDIDVSLPRFMQSTFNIGFYAIGALVSTAVVTPMFLIVLLVLAAIFDVLRRYYSRAAVQLKRIESVSRSPVYNHFSETLLGLATIRSFKVNGRFTDLNMKFVNHSTQAFFLVRCVIQWAQVRIGNTSDLPPYPPPPSLHVHIHS